MSFTTAIVIILKTLILINATSGLPEVNHTLYLPDYTEVVYVDPPIEPLIETLNVVNLTNGEPLPFLLNDSKLLLIPAFGKGTLSITYIGKYAVINETYRISISSNRTIDLIIPQSVIPTRLTTNIVGSKKVDDKLIISLAPGTYSIEYILIPTKLPPPPIEVHEIPLMQYLPYIIFILLVIITVFSVGFAKYRRRTMKVNELSENESKIIELLKKLGGEAYQSDLQKILKIPRTTLWRSIRRLEERGYVDIVKVDGLNKVLLRK